MVLIIICYKGRLRGIIDQGETVILWLEGELWYNLKSQGLQKGVYFLIKWIQEEEEKSTFIILIEIREEVSIIRK